MRPMRLGGDDSASQTGLKRSRHRRPNHNPLQTHGQSCVNPGIESWRRSHHFGPPRPGWEDRALLVRRQTSILGTTMMK